MSAHRALPLVEVERRAREARVAWPMTCNACNTGTPGNCDCPTEAAASVSEFLADPPRQTPPAYPWRALGAGLMVLLVAVSAAHVVATALRPAQQVAQR